MNLRKCNTLKIGTQFCKLIITHLFLSYLNRIKYVKYLSIYNLRNVKIFIIDLLNIIFNRFSHVSCMQIKNVSSFLILSLLQKV